MDLQWWHNSVVYQIYPRSFNDSNGDGIGDIRGITEKLDYLEDLGANVLWLCPLYKSPNVDNGYDISDYYNISEEYGTLEDLEFLVRKARKKGIKIMMDIVANHTSDQHEWFIEASKSKENKYHDYYVWRDGDKDELPNGLTAAFGGPAWTYDESLKQYYLHLFDSKQPDLNWHNVEVRKEFAKIINWWMNKGIEGFRFDVIDLIAKEPDKLIKENGENLHEYIVELGKNSFARKSIVTVGETWGVTPEIGIQYSNPKHEELSMIFQFEHIMLDEIKGEQKWDLKTLDLIEFKKVMEKWQIQLHDKGWNSLFWSNHDLPRVISRWGNDQKYRVESGKMFAILLHFMQGTPYVYQGEEIGMTNIEIESVDDLLDIEAINLYNERIKLGYSKNEILTSIKKKGRDNARSPIQWNTQHNGGFSDGEPWMKVNNNYQTINVENSINDKDSIYYCYKKLISFRRKSYFKDIITLGSFELLLENNKQIFAYKRTYNQKTIVVMCNFYEEHTSVKMSDELVAFSHENILISNYDEIQVEENYLLFRPFESVVFVI